MKYVEMQTGYDCERTACSNYLALQGMDAQRTYETTASFQQPTAWLFRDLWGSPSRVLWMLEKLAGRKVGLVPTNPLLVPCVCLVKQKGSWLYAHWITILSVDPSKGIYHWHDGMKERDDPLPWDIEIALAIGGTGKMPLKWRLWGGLTWPIRRIF